jgi:CheY-like chemotaxis protein
VGETTSDAGESAADAPDNNVVVVVEDYPDIGDLVHGLLEAEGYQVWRVSRGADALGAVQHHRPAVVLLDLSLPDIPGSEVLRLLGEHPEASQIPVIIVSAYADQAIPWPQVRAVVAKPFDLGTLLDAVAQVRQSQSGRA